MISKIRIPLIMGVISLFLSGCLPSTKILEDIQLVQSIGYDYIGDEKFQGTGGSSFITPGEKSIPKSVTFTAEGNTNRKILQKIQSKSPKPIEIGRVGVILFNQEIAKNGIMEHIESLEKDPSVGRDIYLAVSIGSTFEILDGTYPQSESVSQYLTEVIKQNMERTIPKMDLHRYLYHYYGKGLDPFMPVIAHEGRYIQIKGIALFKKDKLVDIIGLKESYVFKVLFESIRKGVLEVDFTEKEEISIRNLSSDTNYKVTKDHEKYQIEVNIKLNGQISDSAGLKLSDDKVIKKIEKATEKQIKEHAANLIKKFQDLEVDPLGMGDKARQKGDFNKKDWQGQYGDMEIKVHADVDVSQSGIAE
ncbi:spore germination protein [Bacillus pakistanensis]|uniref:Spore germination protein n=1 Tax=Rossellomorea pakistanensis TaxID=992288 RepID=A0ABS2N818_9BACI|nr:Ger(x)C family spore germination protein [Bacillus pakistanensis]MBM7584005.1 spore germination protein [Bacillus pakistanensis]